MKQTLIKVLAALLVLAMLVPSFAACNTSGGDGETTTTTDNNAAPEPERDTAALLAANPYAATGLDYVLHVCEKYYDDRTHIVYRGLSSMRYAAEIWYVGAYVEMLTEAYKLYPDNKEVAKYYSYALDKCLPQYLVTNARIKTPDKLYSGMSYYNAGHKSSGDFYFDDNAWICWQYYEAYELLGDKKYLNLANDVLEFLIAGWRTNGGGIYWSKDFGGIGTCSTAPTICCLLKSYELTKNEDHLNKAKEYYSWANEKLMNSGSGLYYAGIGDNWQPSYDQGTMILAGSMLYDLTGEKSYYDAAKKTASRVVAHSFTIEGTRKEYTVKVNENPYYCSWAFTWLVRGMSKFIDVSEKQNELFMTYLKKLLDSREGTQDKKTGLYDHYLGTPNAGWIGDGKMFPSNDIILMSAGYAALLLVVGYYDVHISEDALSAAPAQ